MFCTGRKVWIEDVQYWCSDQDLFELIKSCLSDFSSLPRLLFFGEFG
jgi:hypothetical protein